MSTEFIAMTTQDILFQEHNGEWKINKLSFMKRSLQIPVFPPIPNIDVKFCFEVLYQKISLPNYNEKVSLFKVMLVKLFASEIQPCLKLAFNVTVNYTDGTLFKECKCLPGISVNEMDSITCIDAISKFNDNSGTFNATYTNHYHAMQSDSLILKLRMRFFGHLGTPSVYRQEMRSLNNLKNFAKDFSTLLKPSSLSDITIRIGGKDLPAHRAVLTAHSPVFRKMMESDFLESKTNTITISDFKYDIFECFLKYLYSGEVENKSWSNVRELYVLADKYDVQVLKRECAEITASFLTVDQACEILTIAYDYNDSDLKEEAKDFAAKHFHELVRTAEWNALVASHPIIGYEVIASAYFVPINVLENKETATLASCSNQILKEEKGS